MHLTRIKIFPLYNLFFRSLPVYTAPYIYIPGLPLQCTLLFLSMPCQLRFEPATINLITNWGKFCTCSLFACKFLKLNICKQLDKHMFRTVKQNSGILKDDSRTTMRPVGSLMPITGRNFFFLNRFLNCKIFWFTSKLMFKFRWFPFLTNVKLVIISSTFWSKICSSC